MIRFIIKRRERINGENLPDELETVLAECPELESILNSGNYDCEHMHSYKLYILEGVEVLERRK